jgi:hypothetical protein
MARNDQESREQSQLFAVTIRGGLEFADCAAVGISGREEGPAIGNGRSMSKLGQKATLQSPPLMR